MRKTVIRSAAATILVLCAGSFGSLRAGRQRERNRALSRDDLGPDVQSGYLAVDRGEVLWARSAAPRTSRWKPAISVSAPASSKAPSRKCRATSPTPTRSWTSSSACCGACRTFRDSTPRTSIAHGASPARAARRDMEDLVAFIANKSNGMKIDIPLEPSREQEMAAVGEALFYRRGGVNDFSCATCHADEGKRIRLQGLPTFSKPGKPAQETMGGWPTYRVSQGALRTMQHRLWDCLPRSSAGPCPNTARTP